MNFRWFARPEGAVPALALPRREVRLRRVHRLAPGEDAWAGPVLPAREGLADIVGCKPMTISRIIALLEQNGVVRCVQPKYCSFTKKAKEYVLAVTHSD